MTRLTHLGSPPFLIIVEAHCLLEMMEMAMWLVLFRGEQAAPRMVLRECTPACRPLMTWISETICAISDDPPASCCGNGIEDPGEECDDGNNDNNDGCDANCITEFCGDGITNDGDEECDDGNTVDGDGCNANCITEFCGDGITNDGDEECDDGNTVDEDGCVPTALPSSVEMVPQHDGRRRVR